jgi:hypothetical protein
MRLPFAREQFFDLFAAYYEALWPGAVGLSIRVCQRGAGYQ